MNTLMAAMLTMVDTIEMVDFQECNKQAKMKALENKRRKERSRPQVSRFNVKSSNRIHRRGFSR